MNKKFLKIIISTLTIVGLTQFNPIYAHANGTTNPSIVSQTNTYTLKIVTGTNVNFRTAPTTASEVISKLKGGTEVKLISESGKWSQIEYNGIVGYMSTQYLGEITKSQIVNSLNLNFRKTPSTNGEIICKIPYGSKVKYISNQGSWTKIEYNKTTGYVSSQYLINDNNIDNTIKYNKFIIGAFTNFRNSPNENSQVIDVLRYGLKVGVIEQIGSWSKINYNGQIGFVSSNNLGDLNTNPPTDPSTPQGDELTRLAKSLLEKPYVWGEMGPDSFDCSGFTSYLYKTVAGITLPRESVDQSKYGKYIKKNQWHIGDLLFFDTEDDGIVNHVGMYIGNGEFIHASQKFKKVIISPLNGFYMDKYTNARRVL